MAFAPRKREICPLEFLDVVRDASEEIEFIETEFRDETASEQKPPVSEETHPPSDDESPF
jgi:hypothetical protein